MTWKGPQILCQRATLPEIRFSWLVNSPSSVNLKVTPERPPVTVSSISLLLSLICPILSQSVTSSWLAYFAIYA